MVKQAFLTLMMALYVLIGTAQQPGTAKVPKPNKKATVEQVVWSADGLTLKPREWPNTVETSRFSKAPFKKAFEGTEFHLPSITPKTLQEHLIAACLQVIDSNKITLLKHSVNGQITGAVANNEYVDFYRLPGSNLDEGHTWWFTRSPDMAAMDAATAYYHKTDYVSNAEYCEFLKWVRDSIARRILYEDRLFETTLYSEEEKYPPQLPWNPKINWNESAEREALEDLYFPEHGRYYSQRRIDARKLMYEYYLLDAVALNSTNSSGSFNRGTQNSGDTGMLNYYDAIVKRISNVYPDTLIWVNKTDGNKELATAFMHHYLWHPDYADYPVVGVSPDQARAFLEWKSKMHYVSLAQQNGNRNRWVEYRLPTVQQNELQGTPSAPTLKLERDDLKFWQISVQDYQQFTRYAIDSIAMTLLGYNGYPQFFEVNKKGEVGNLSYKEQLNWSNMPVAYAQHLETAGFFNKEMLANEGFANIEEAVNAKHNLLELVQMSYILFKHDYYEFPSSWVELDLNFRF